MVFLRRYRSLRTINWIVIKHSSDMGVKVKLIRLNCNRSLNENQALYDAVDDAGRLDKSTAAGGDQLSQGREQNIKARAFKSYWQKANHFE